MFKSINNNYVEVSEITGKLDAPSSHLASVTLTHTAQVWCSSVASGEPFALVLSPNFVFSKLALPCSPDGCPARRSNHVWASSSWWFVCFHPPHFAVGTLSFGGCAVSFHWLVQLLLEQTTNRLHYWLGHGGGVHALLFSLDLLPPSQSEVLAGWVPQPNTVIGLLMVRWCFSHPYGAYCNIEVLWYESVTSFILMLSNRLRETFAFIHLDVMCLVWRLGDRTTCLKVHQLHLASRWCFALVGNTTGITHRLQMVRFLDFQNIQSFCCMIDTFFSCVIEPDSLLFMDTERFSFLITSRLLLAIPVPGENLEK